jgi:hypothetical protein
MDEVQKYTNMVLIVTHHHQNPLELICTTSMYWYILLSW